MISIKSRFIDPLQCESMSPIVRRFNPLKPPLPSNREFSQIINENFVWASKMSTQSIFDCGLIDYLVTTIKHYFLLGSGEWVLNFLELSFNDLTLSSSTVDSERLSFLIEIVSSKKVKFIPKVELLNYSIFGHIMAVLNLSSDHPINFDEIKRSSSDLSARKSLTTLEAISLTCECPFPLNLVVTPVVLLKLSPLFRHFLMLRYTEKMVVSLWEHQSLFRKNGKIFQNSNLDGNSEKFEFFMSVIKYRQQMLHFIQTFLFYCSTSVIEPQWKNLLENLAASQTPSAMKIFMNEFADALLQQCLLTNKDVFKRISQAIKSINTFCRHIHRVLSSGTDELPFWGCFDYD
ncbi:hypothetical protein GEMRC1_002624 [Eukaryota sp. GEM-RC1]